MFLYRTEVRVATEPKMGLGLFAKEFIAKDSVVWKFFEGIDLKLHVSEVEKLSDVHKEYFEKYAWIEIGEEDYYYSSCDLTNFMNHSDKPNIGSKGKQSVALRDIAIGEEIFMDYGSFVSNFDGTFTE
jgi:SET domain-containing protein